jgi:hypothetical protein
MTDTRENAALPRVGDGEDFLYASEAAQRLGISAPTLRGLARRGVVTAYRSPLERRATFYKREELDALEMEPLQLAIRSD